MKDVKLTELKKHNNGLPYRLRGQLLSAPEAALFRALQEMVENRYVICPKVALNDIFMIVRPNENVHYFNKIFRKHVDFLLCEPGSMHPAFGVEIVKPVSKNETRAADQFLEDIFMGAGLPLVHIPSAMSYDVRDLINLFQIAVTKARSRPLKDLASDSVPMCPVCGKMMVLRVHRRGLRKGKEFYGCMDNPRCPGVVELKS